MLVYWFNKSCQRLLIQSTIGLTLSRSHFRPQLITRRRVDVFIGFYLMFSLLSVVGCVFVCVFYVNKITFEKLKNDPGTGSKN